MKTSQSLIWEDFLLSPAITYPSHDIPNNVYWSSNLLQKWQSIYTHRNEATKEGVSTINYGSLLLLACHTSKILEEQILAATKHRSDLATTSRQDARIGLAIPEGPFLPLFVLTIHALNVSKSLLVDNSPIKENVGQGAVVLIPMETDEAPERLRHILSDSDPDMIIVSPGRDMDDLIGILDDNSSIELLDFTVIVEEALQLIAEESESRHAIERLFPDGARDVMVDSWRYEHAIPGSWDVARLVAWGCIMLDSDKLGQKFADVASINKTIVPLSSDRCVMSHIVYTSGTTGKPKGCVSSLGSLQQYIRAKNKAHCIQRGQSTILLASAITFDPCFSDVLASFVANATLAISSRDRLYGYSDNEKSIEDNSETSNYQGLTSLLRLLKVTHVLCTPTLWATVAGDPNNVPYLQVIALGGEPIPKAIQARWARLQTKGAGNTTQHAYNHEYPRLCATYGVTEACVYQTCGEIFQFDEEVRHNQGQSVGQPLLGTAVHICRPMSEECVDPSPSLEMLPNIHNSKEPAIGEVVLLGAQLDSTSSYLNRPALSKKVFIESKIGSDDTISHAYRTGDLGYIHPTTENLHIIGRIKGDGMVKVNGVRIELAEIESALIDDLVDERKGGGLVVDCMATTTMARSNDDSAQKQIVAFCIVSSICASELRINPNTLKTGIIIEHGPLLAVLKARCDQRVKKGCTPSFFVLIDRLPLSPTGKRDRSRLPRLEICTLMGADTSDNNLSLWEFGDAGPIVADKVCDCLNLQPCQRSTVTRGSNFFALGGDSLSATRVCRGLYALHHGVTDSRNLGGATGTLEGPFSAKHLLSFPTLGDYVQFLDVHKAFQHRNDHQEGNNKGTAEVLNHASLKDNSTYQHKDMMYEYLIEAISLGLSCVASSLLDLGVDPNGIDRKMRLGKVKDRSRQRQMFKASPLHLACVRGEPFLVKKLLAAGCKANTPDAQGSFPIHLACSRMDDDRNRSMTSIEDDLNRLECVKLLLEVTPISIKDGNKQTILHSAARSGHCHLLKHIMVQWKIASNTIGIKFKSHNNEPDKIYDWYDRWFRTPVHWAVLNKRVDALRILLDGGCSASPAKPKSGVSKRSTNVIIETPKEMCMRLYSDVDEVGKQINAMLSDH